MLVFGVELLTGRLFAAAHGNRSEPEWPPHPARFFAALAAAHYEGSATPAEREALLWLERQEPPSIASSPVQNRVQPTVFVPTNDEPGHAPLVPNSGRQPRGFPAAVPEVPRLYYIYQDAPIAPIWQALEHLAGGVSFLGSSRSLVGVTVLDSLPAEATGLVRYEPCRNGDTSLRVPSFGHLDRLDEAFALGRHLNSSRTSFYQRRLPGQELPSVAEGDLEGWILFRTTGGPRLEIQHAPQLAARLRHRLIEEASPEASALLRGLGHRPHPLLVPLPFVGHRHADGHLLGLAVILPRGLSAQDHALLLRTLPEELLVPYAESEPWRADLVQPSTIEAELPANLRRSTWAQPSTRWTTVTPMLADHHVSLRPDALQTMVGRACTHLGLPVPLNVTPAAMPWFRGSEPASRFTFWGERGDSRRRLLHVTLEFPVRVAGPLVLGAGRYYGLGLCRPLEEGR